VAFNDQLVEVAVSHVSRTRSSMVREHLNTRGTSGIVICCNNIALSRRRARDGDSVTVMVCGRTVGSCCTGLDRCVDCS
jgi:hypothetical protein